MIENTRVVFVAVGIFRGGCYAGEQLDPAIVFSIHTINNEMWQMSPNRRLTNPLNSVSIPIAAGTWYTITLRVLSDHSETFVKGNLVEGLDFEEKKVQMTYLISL